MRLLTRVTNAKYKYHINYKEELACLPISKRPHPALCLSSTLNRKHGSLTGEVGKSNSGRGGLALPLA